MGPEQVILFKSIIYSIINLSKMTYFSLSQFLSFLLLYYILSYHVYHHTLSYSILSSFIS